jgi:uncharacterized protein YbjT (DUF2867 family)
MSNKILVTGASGNIGQPLVAALAGAKADFAVLRSKATDVADGVEIRIASFDDVAALTQAFSGIDTLFLLFPLVENKLALAKNAVAAALAAGVKNIVRSSGAGADPNSAFSLPRLQGEIDALLSASGIPCTFLRPGGFMQNYATYQSQAIQAGTIYIADGGQAQALIDTRDIADVAAAILINPAAHAGKAYTLTGGVAFTGSEAAASIAQALGKAIEHISISTEQAAETMRQWGMSAFTVDVLDSLNQVISAGYASAVSPEVENILARKPRLFASYVQEQLAHWRT